MRSRSALAIPVAGIDACTSSAVGKGSAGAGGEARLEAAAAAVAGDAARESGREDGREDGAWPCWLPKPRPLATDGCRGRGGWDDCRPSAPAGPPAPAAVRAFLRAAVDPAPVSVPVPDASDAFGEPWRLRASDDGAAVEELAWLCLDGRPDGVVEPEPDPVPPLFLAAAARAASFSLRLRSSSVLRSSSWSRSDSLSEL